jgi:hypothetical protein
MWQRYSWCYLFASRSQNLRKRSAGVRGSRSSPRISCAPFAGSLFECLLLDMIRKSSPLDGKMHPDIRVDKACDLPEPELIDVLPRGLLD